MKTMRILFAVAAMLCTPLAAAQQGGGNDQMYFLAQAAPLGSLSREGLATQVVYLRWDMQEGGIPADIARLVLTRDGEEIFTAPADGSMSAGQVQALYDGPGQSRRKAEMLRRLNAESVAEGGSGISPGALGGAVLARLGRDPLWGFMASRIDFNVARARYRGYLDRPGVGSFSYELLAEDAAGSRRRLGLIKLDTRMPQSVAAPLQLQQIIQGRCDAPSGGLDDGAVSLFWRHGGATSTDRLANSLQISGYDIWRSARPLAPAATVAPRLDLRAMAAQSAHGSGGEIALPDMQRVNDEPILLTSDDSGLISAQYVQQSTETAAAGQRPGSRWSYYVVPRDFTGQYGPAVGIVVEIPDRLPPPAPWRLDTWEQPGTGELSLEWDPLSVDAYMAAHDDGRQFCNAAAVRNGDTSRLAWVEAGATCAAGPRRVVNLGVADFRVYRFDNYEAASRFTDADGDGVADRVERTLDGPGMACDADAQPAGATSFRADHPQHAPVRSIGTADGRTRMMFRDATPAQQQNADHSRPRYWYRVAAIGSNGRMSPMSAPVRGFIPDRRLPSAPGDSVVRLVGQPACAAYEVSFVEGKGKGDNNIIDSAGVADAVTAGCIGGPAISRIAFPRPANGQRQDLRLGSQQCETLHAACGEFAQLNFVRGEKRFASGVLRPLSECSGTLEMRGAPANPTIGGNSCEAEPEVIDGQALDEAPRIFANTPQCISLYRDFGRLPGSDLDTADSYRIGTWCQPDAGQPLDINLPNPEPGTAICLSVSEHNENARVSPRRRLPCFSVNEAQEAPPVPTPVGLSFSGDRAELSWLPSLMRSSATIIELSRKGAPVSDLPLRLTAPHPGARASDGVRTVTLDLPPAPSGNDWREEWCMTLVAIGQGMAPQAGRVLSDASAPLCVERTPDGGAPSEYLPWPAIAPPPTMGVLPVGYYEEESALMLRIGSEPFVMPEQGGNQCDAVQPAVPSCAMGKGKDGERCLDGDPVVMACVTPSHDRFCNALRTAAGPALNFVAWRQSRPADGGQATDFVQVSPLIDRVHCTLEQLDVPVDGRVYLNKLDDPYVQLLDPPEAFGPAWSGPRLIYVDRYPHQRGRDYRYEFVYFDARGEITATRTSDWVSVP